MIAYVGKHEFMGRKYGKLLGGKSASVSSHSTVNKALGVSKKSDWFPFSSSTSVLGHQRGPRLWK
jgi:hypothetical protein